MDIAAAATIIGGAIASKEIVEKVLGPTAEYFGGEIKNLVHRCNVNLSDVFNASIRKGAAEGDGGVDARTAKAIIDDAAYCDDMLIKDYYGGLLCAAKSEGENDEALSYVSILKQLSRVQVKTHFLIYALIRQKATGDISSITDEAERGRVRIVIGFERYFEYLNGDFDDFEATTNHVISGLQRAGLIGNYFRYGSPEYINSVDPELNVTQPSLVVCPSILGAELFLWAAGVKNANPNLIVDPTVDILSSFPEEYRESVCAVI